MSPARYLDTLLPHTMAADRATAGSQQLLNRYVLAQITDQATKRVLFSSRQAIYFDALAQPPPDEVQGRLRPPFDRFYLEFDAPILTGEPEAGHQDALRAILAVPGTRALPFRPDPAAVQGPVHTITMFFHEGAGTERENFTDRTWFVHLPSGTALTQARALLDIPAHDPSGIPPGYAEHPERFVVAGEGGGEGRHIGWWERFLVRHTALLSWVLCYMMAAGIEVVEEPLTRAERRRAERERTLPIPWHIVRVRPRMGSATPNPEPLYRHRYRYDVRGFLRVNRHHTREGVREVIEWVPPHQRGLDNDLYIPSTWDYKGGMPVDPRAQRYFGGQAPPRGGGS